MFIHRYQPIIFIVAFIICLCLYVTSAAAQSVKCLSIIDIPTAECQILFDFHEATSGAVTIIFDYTGEGVGTEVILGWGHDADWFQGTNTACDWTGITCEMDDSEMQHVTELVLPSTSLTFPLSGTLPTTLYNLPALKTLDVSDNRSLGGDLPITLADSNITTLIYTDTAITIPNDPVLCNWLNQLPTHTRNSNQPCSLATTAVQLQQIDTHPNDYTLLLAVLLTAVTVATTLRTR